MKDDTSGSILAKSNMSLTNFSNNSLLVVMILAYCSFSSAVRSSSAIRLEKPMIAFRGVRIS